jgi:hypothetical protein
MSQFRTPTYPESTFPWVFPLSNYWLKPLTTQKMIPFCSSTFHCLNLSSASCSLPSSLTLNLTATLSFCPFATFSSRKQCSASLECLCSPYSPVAKFSPFPLSSNVCLLCSAIQLIKLTVMSPALRNLPGSYCHGLFTPRIMLLSIFSLMNFLLDTSTKCMCSPTFISCHSLELLSSRKPPLPAYRLLELSL